MRRSIVYLCISEQTVRNAVTSILVNQEFEVVVTGSAEEIIESYDPNSASCLAVDFHLPATTCIELTSQLSKQGCPFPFIVLSPRAMARDVIAAMRHGALDVLEPPFNAELFLNRVNEGLNKDRDRIRRNEEHSLVQQLLESLTPRQREILDMVVDGMLTKQIATRLDVSVSVKTIEVHRSNITKKMKVKSVVHLVRMIMKHRSSANP